MNNFIISPDDLKAFYGAINHTCTYCENCHTEIQIKQICNML